jgi:hypothetical protein
MPNLLEAATEEALKQVRERKASSFTVGGYIKDGQLVGGATFDRSWRNGLGLTAYLKAYWNDLPVSVGSKSVTAHAPKVEAGVELTKRF